MSFGFVGDVVFGLVVTALVLGWLDYRKRRWRGRSARPGPSTQSPYASPGYSGGLKGTPTVVFPPNETIHAAAELARQRRLDKESRR